MNFFENLDFFEILKFYNSLPMVFRPLYPWYFNPPTHGISNTYPWYFDPPTHGILNPLPMVYPIPIHGILTPPTHGIFTPLYMIYQTLSYGIMNPSLLVEMREVNLPWGGSTYNDKYWKLTLGSIYHGGQNTKMTPVMLKCKKDKTVKNIW